MRRTRAGRGYTLIELLIVVTLLGIASALVIPQIGSTQAIRIQTTVRALVADITMVQSDALARQESRAIQFDAANNRYSIFRVRGSTLQPQDLLQVVQLSGETDRGLVGRLDSADFSGSGVLVFDELGGPVQGLGSTAASTATGTIRIRGFNEVYEIRVEAYTGRVRVERVTGQP